MVYRYAAAEGVPTIRNVNAALEYGNEYTGATRRLADRLGIRRVNFHPYTHAETAPTNVVSPPN